MGLWFQFRLLLADRFRDPAVEAVEIEIDHRRDVERQQLRQQKTAYHRDAQGLAQFGTRTRAERDRQRAEDRGERRHHDRPEAQKRRLADRLQWLHAVAAALDREVDHHDRVFLHDAHQQHDADYGDHRKIHPEQKQREQRADAGGRQARQDRDRVNEALIENAEHDIDHEDRRDDQERLARERILEHRRGALKAGRDAQGQIRLLFDFLNLRHRVTERHARFQVEGNRNRRKLLQMVDLQRPDRLANLGDGFDRHQASARRADIGLREIGGARLKFRVVLDDDLVLVRRGIKGRDLARAELAIERTSQLILGEAERRRLVAIDVDRKLRIGDLQIGGDVAEEIDLRNFFEQFRRGAVERLGIRPQHRVLILALRYGGTDSDVLYRLEEYVDAGDTLHRRAQALNQVVGA